VRWLAVPFLAVPFLAVPFLAVLRGVRRPEESVQATAA